MAGMGVYVVLLTVIGVAALPVNKFKLPPDYHPKDFIRELSKQSPNYEKVGQFFKGFYLALNGLKEMEKPDPYPINSSSIQRAHQDLRGPRWKDPRRREIAKSVNVSIVLLTPSPIDIIEKSLGFQKKEAVQRSIDENHAKVLNRTKKHHKVDEKISVALPVKLPKVSKASKDKRPFFGIASFLLWLIIVGFLFYYFCSGKNYKEYFQVQPNSSSVNNNSSKKDKKVKVTKMQLSLPSEAVSSRRSSSTDGERSEGKRSPRSTKKSFSVKFASDGSESGSKMEDSPSASAKPPDVVGIEKKTRQSLKLLKNLFNKVLSSETIPQRSASEEQSSFTVESDKPIKSQEHYSSDNSEKFNLRFSAKDSPIHLDLKRSQPYPTANIPTPVNQKQKQQQPIQQQQYNAMETEPRPYFGPSNCRGGIVAGDGGGMPPQEENPRLSTPLIKEDYNTHTVSSDDKKGKPESEVKKKKSKKTKKCKKKPLTMDKPILNEDFKNVKEAAKTIAPMKQAKKSCIVRKKKVTFSRVIKVQTFVLKTDPDQFDKCFHVFDDGSPWFRVYRKSKTPMNSPSNDPLYKFPKAGPKGNGKGGNGKDGKKPNYSIAILLKQKLKQKK